VPSRSMGWETLAGRSDACQPIASDSRGQVEKAAPVPRRTLSFPISPTSPSLNRWP